MSGFLNSFSIDVPDLRAEAYLIDPQPMSDGWEQLDQYEKDVSRQISGDAYRYRDGGTWYLLIAGESRPQATFDLNGAKATWEETRNLNYDNERHQEIVQRLLRDNLRWYLTTQLDYWERGRSHEFYNRTPRQTVKEYEAYDGYDTQVEYSDGFYLTVDPKVKFISVHSIYDHLEDPGISESYFEREYLGRYCTLMSTQRPAVELVSIADDISVSDESMEVNGERKSVLEYLNENPDRYPPEIVETVDPEEPIAKVRFPWSDSPVDAAPSLLRPSPDGMSGYMTNYAASESNERWQDTISFVQQIDFISVQGEECPVADQPRSSDVGEFDYPALQYGDGEPLGLGDVNPETGNQISRQNWNKAIEAALRSYGAAKIPRGAPEIGVIHPDGHTDTASVLYDEVREYIEEYTHYQLPSRTGTVNYEDPQKIREWVRMYGEQTDGVLVLLDDPSDYDEIRAILDGLPAQGITIENFENNNSRGFDDVLFNAALGFATKLGVRPVLLARPLSSDLYFGFSVAGDQVNTASAVALSGQDGDLVYQTTTNMAAGSGTITEEQIARQLIRQGVSDAARATDQPITSITIHRNGQFGDVEVDGIKEGINRLSESGILPEEVAWSAVQIGSNSRYRLYGSEEDEFECATGAYAALDAHNGVIATYGRPQIHQGTPHPLHCTVEAGSHVPEIESILRDVLALSMINWGAPTKKTKEPLTTHLPQKMHDIFAAGARIDYPPF